MEIMPFKSFHEINNAYGTSLYSDHAIYIFNTGLEKSSVNQKIIKSLGEYYLYLKGLLR